MTKHLTVKRIALTATLTLTTATLALTGAAFAHSASPTSGAFSPAATRLRTMVMRPDELTGFAIVNCPAVQDDPADWAATDTAAIPALRAEGFELGISELLYSASLHAGATSIAAKFSSASGARNDIERQADVARANGSPATFTVVGIPGAHGSTVSTQNATAYQVAFAVGDYEYSISISFPDNQLESYPAPAETNLFGAAHLVYKRATERK